MLVDTHAHVDAIDPVHLHESPLARDPCWRALCPGVTPSRSTAAFDRFSGDPRIVFAVGWHPWHLPPEPSDRSAAALDRALRDVEELVRTSPAGRIVAIGETGLDHHRVPASCTYERARVESFLRAHVRLARTLELPLVLHCVRAWGRLLACLDTEPLPDPPGIVHAFSGSAEVARELVDRGFVLGLGCPLVDPRARRVRDAVTKLPDHAWVLETDAPYLRPRDSGRASGIPDDLLRVAAEVATLRGTTPADVFASSARNAARVLGTWGDPASAWSR